MLLWSARVLAVEGRRGEAERVFGELAGLGEAEGGEAEGVAALQAVGAAESRRPLGRLRLRTVVPDVFLVDATLPGR